MSQELVSERLARLLYPQTLGFLVVLALVFVVLSILVRLPQTLLIDIRATRFLQRAHTPFLNRLAEMLTFLGNTRVLVALAVPIDAALAIAGLWWAALLHAATILGVPLNVWIKSFFARERPGEQHEVRIHSGPRWGTSYPSGHAMVSTMYYGFLATLAFLHVTQPGLRLALIGLFAVLPPLISLSRVYLAAHWLSDVTGGVAVGLLLLLLYATLYPV